ncbi:hypothetical protein [Streptomyces somaliensis]|uniref:hypothetical protein n=1 Tax=Streptomyces somaliensis TaxID=78355 RepID=UPI0034E94480|nr:hypothetical protein [Streptomyces somaliensis]
MSGVYLPDAQGEDVAAGNRDPLPLEELGPLAPAAYARSWARTCGGWTANYGDLCAVEFTVERGRLWRLGGLPGPARAVPGALLTGRLTAPGPVRTGAPGAEEAGPYGRRRPGRLRSAGLYAPLRHRPVGAAATPPGR